MALDDKHWFTEVAEEAGSAFSLRIEAKLHEEKTRYQEIAVYQTVEWGKLLTIDGFVMLSERDHFLYHEMLSHPALFTHPRPRRVLIVGGGDCGVLHEVLKHPGIEAAWQVEIDERVTRVAERYFPELTASNGDPRAQLEFADGIRWVEDAAPESYDVIIVDSTDPYGPAEALFGEPFYRHCRRALGPEGLLVHQSESPLVHTDLLKSMQGAMRSAGFLDVLTIHFPQPVYPSGWWSASMASKALPVTGFREEAAEEKPFPTRYYNAAVHRACMATPEFLYRAMTAE